MKHFSHPHSLKLLESTNNEDENDEEILCSGCEVKVSSPDAYTCTKRKCDFVLHKSCCELPMKTEHKSHPEHPLRLLSEPPYYSIYYDCNACDDLINGFSYNCDECVRFRLHVKCASLPEYVACKAHSHTLEMRYYTPEAGRYCDVCDGSMREGYWSYFCKECDFGTHLDCAFSAEAVSEKDKEEKNEKSKEEWEVENENEDGDEEGEKDEEDEYEVEVENEDEDEGEGDKYEVRVENDDGDEDKENENEDEEENEDDGSSEQQKLLLANVQAMERMARINLQLQLAEMNARFIRFM